MDAPEVLRKAIADRKDELELGVRELARRTDMGPSQLSDFLNGKRQLNSMTLDRLLIALDLIIVPPDRI